MFPEPRPRLWSLDFIALTVVLGIGVFALGLRELAGFLLVARWYMLEAVPAVLLVELGGQVGMMQYVGDRGNWLALSAVVAAFVISALLNFQAVSANGASAVMFPALTMVVVSVGLSVLEYMLAYVWSVRFVGHTAADIAWQVRKAEWENAEHARQLAERREARRQRQAEKVEALPEPEPVKAEGLTPTERRAAIVEMLERKPDMTTAELAAAFGVSDRTIRGDRGKL